MTAGTEQEQAKSQGQIASAAANIAAVLHSYDVDGGMAKPPLHYFTSDSSAQDTVSEVSFLLLPISCVRSRTLSLSLSPSLSLACMNCYTRIAAVILVHVRAGIRKQASPT
jgi:hypothetical protein